MHKSILAGAMMLATVAAYGQATSTTPDHSKPSAEAAAGFERTPAPADAYVYIGSPTNGQTVRTPLHIWFGTHNFGVAPAGTYKPNTGHHNLLIDTPLPPMDEPLPSDKNHLHFGLGQTEAVIDLPPGAHTLQLLMADGDHVPHDPPVMSKQITIYVRPTDTPVAQAR